MPPAREHPDDAEPRPDVVGTAATLAEVGLRDAHIAVAAGLEEHLLEQDALARLAVGPLGDLRPHVGQPRGLRVAHPLELAEGQEPRAAEPGPERAHLRLLVTGTELGQRLREVALEPGDLPTQRLARRVLVDLGKEREDREIPDRRVDRVQLLQHRREGYSGFSRIARRQPSSTAPPRRRWPARRGP